MLSKQRALCIVCTLTAMTAVGCYSHYPSSVYGPGGHPGGLAPAGGAYPQGGSYVLPAAPLQGSGSSLGPSGTFPTPVPDGSANRWQPGNSGDAPAYDPNGAGTTPGANENPVPNYQDPGGAPSGFDGNGGFGDTEDFGAPASGSSQTAPDPTAPFDPAGGNSSPFNEAAVDSDDAPYVTPEVSLTQVSTVRNVIESPSNGLTAAPSPYKFDREKYRWLRGVVDYDGEAKTWNIIYDLEPDPQDRFGGSLLLTDADKLNTLESGDVVLVEGSVDVKRVDAFGKPMYRADRIVRLEPAN